MGWFVLAVAVVVFLGSVTLLLRRILASHDEIYDGLTPGVLPPREERKTTPTKRLRSTEYKGPFPVAFTPPRDVTPGLIGMVIDGVVDPRDLTATIVDLAARGFLRIEVLDDGASSPAPSSGDPAGYGLVGIRERVASHGGSLEAGARPDGGFHLRAVLPLGVQEDA